MAAEEGEVAVAAEGVGGEFGYLAPTTGEVAGTLAGAAGVGAAATAGLAVGTAGGAAYGLARGTGWVLENTLFRPQQGSEDAAVQDVRSANNMNERRHAASALHAAHRQQHFQAAAPPRSPASVRRRSPTIRRTPSPWGRAPVPGSHAGACLRPALTSWRETLRLLKKNN